MGIFDMFKKKKNTEIEEQKKQERIRAFQESENRDYSNIIEIATIISNSDKQVVEDMTLLVKDTKAFIEKYHDWCEEMDIRLENRYENLRQVLAYWLCGYDTEFKYGNYIDWKEETEEIIWGLKPAIEKLGYPLSFDGIDFTGEEFTYEAMKKINEHFMKSGYNLFALDTDSDCYHLFIAPIDKYNRICELAKPIEFRFFNSFE